jgi:hypothetical protein
MENSYMKDKYAIIDFTTKDVMKDEYGSVVLYNTEEEAAMACGIYEFSNVWVIKLCYNHVEEHDGFKIHVRN